VGCFGEASGRKPGLTVSIEEHPHDQSHQGPDRFAYSQHYLANDMVARQLGDPNAVTALIETVYSRVSPNKINFTKQITQLNFDALMKGVKKYDRTTESGSKTLCAS